MSAKERLLAWVDQFDNDHYEVDVYGEKVTVDDLPRETVEKVIDITLLLMDRVVEAQGEVTTAEYEELEKKVRKEYPKKSEWVFHVMLRAVQSEKLFGRYKDIEPMIGKLQPRGYPMDSAPYLLTVRPELHELIYAVIRHVDDVKENYDSLAYTFFIGVLTKCWGEGFGWSKDQEGNWTWRNSDYYDQGEKKP